MQAGMRSDIVQTVGKRTYVDVLVLAHADGTEEPQLIVLPNGRTFSVVRTVSRHRVVGGEVFSVQIGSRMTSLWKDTHGLRGARWYVNLRMPSSGQASVAGG